MQQQIEYDNATGFRLQREQGRFPFNLSAAFAAQKQHWHRVHSIIKAQENSAVLFDKHFVVSNINAAALPGVFLAD